MKFIDLFSGLGGFTKGLESARHECIGHCEFDKFAEASYRSIHTITDEQRNYLATLEKKERQREILKDEYLNGEWYKKDIREIKPYDIPKADCWTFGAPCQDFSIAGKREGLDGERSSLVREVFRILGGRQEEDRPEWLIYENVKGMLSSNRGLDYLKIVNQMDSLGYDTEWQNINSSWFVPQNRERIYTIGHLRRRGRKQILPVERADGENTLQRLIDGSQGNRVYDPKGLSTTINAQSGGKGARTGGEFTENARTIIARYNSGVGNRKGEGSAIAILTPGRLEKRQNGRRFKTEGEDMFTLTSQDRHGVVLKIKEGTKKEYKEAMTGDSINYSFLGSKTRRGRVKKGI